MKTQERIIYIGYTMIYFMIGFIFLSATIFFTKSIFKMPFIVSIIMIPFMLALVCGTIMIFVQGVKEMLSVLLSFTNSKLLFNIQKNISKLNDFMKKLPNHINRTSMIIFLGYWFLCIIVWGILAVTEKNSTMLLCLIPSIIASIFIGKNISEN